MVTLRVSYLIGLLAGISLGTLVSAAVIEVTSTEHFNELKPKGAVVAKFYATWCGPCKKLSPLYKDLAGKGGFGDVTFLAIDIDKHNEIATKHGVKGVPTTIFFAEGREVDRMVGGQDDFVSEASKVINNKMKSGGKVTKEAAKEPAKKTTPAKKKTAPAKQKKVAPKKTTCATCPK
ncbi:thioredoxin family protein [Candidatus Dependentiae bacterium]|nr:thioredoxin family protein [Candidatus Dependentiae bacterium]